MSLHVLPQQDYSTAKALVLTLHLLEWTHLTVGGDSATSETLSTTLVRAVERVARALLQVSSSDLLISGDERAVLALLMTQTTLRSHVLLHCSSPARVSTLVATVHNLERAAVD